MTKKDYILIADSMIEVYRKAKYSGRITETAGQLFIDLGGSSGAPVEVR